MKLFTKKYQLWVKIDGNYSLTELDTVEECMTATKYTDDWYITKKVSLSIKDAEEDVQKVAKPNITLPIRQDEEIGAGMGATESAYLNGPIGNIN